MTRRLAIHALLAISVAACGGPGPPTAGPPASAPTTAAPPATASAGPGAVATPGATRTAVVTSAAPGVAARVSRVVDGDTLKVRIAGRTETVRVIGLDTPESVKPGTPVECFAIRAATEAERLLPVGAEIGLEADPTQATRDQYGRLLAHVWLSDGSLFAEEMIRGGFGIHYVYGGVPSIHARRLAAAEGAARAAQRGIWSPSTCAGRVHLPAR